jgi:hypothetical protein
VRGGIQIYGGVGFLERVLLLVYRGCDMDKVFTEQASARIVKSRKYRQ